MLKFQSAHVHHFLPIIFFLKKFIIFMDEGYPPPLAENSAKIINLIFEPFPYLIELQPFPLNQVSQDASLGYQQEALWSTLKFQYFLHWPLLRGL